MLNIEVQHPSGLSLNLDVIPEFKTGEIICDIISKLERQEISGLHQKVGNQAACFTI